MEDFHEGMCALNAIVLHLRLNGFQTLSPDISKLAKAEGKNMSQ
jgi:hypothetical protein